MNRRWEQITWCITRKDNTAWPLFFMAGLVFRAFPSKDQKQCEQRKHSGQILELSPSMLLRITSFSVGMMVGGPEGIGKEVSNKDGFI